jgi:hypothetical protein
MDPRRVIRAQLVRKTEITDAELDDLAAYLSRRTRTTRTP